VKTEKTPDERLARFERKFFDSTEDFTVIGAGSFGGKAKGLAFIRKVIAERIRPFAGVEVSIPRLTVLATGLFDQFIMENGLFEIALSDEPDDRIAHAFQKSSLPVTIVGDLHALIESIHQPLAVRSSSLLEDAMYRPFAGVYGTKMIPNNQHDPEVRFRKLIEAIKFVYASTFFREAKNYIRSIGKTSRDEKMAVVIQEVVGQRHGDRFYPDVSGVGRSYNFYPFGLAEAREGVVSLALGLGKTIVDGGMCWSYSPAWPKVPPPFGSARDLLRQTQTRYWAVNMGKPPAYDPIRETEYLVEANTDEAEADGTLHHIASTYDAQSDRIVAGIGSGGPRAITFSPILGLEVFPINDLVRETLHACKEAVGAEVEIEFAITLPPNPSEGITRFGFLQVRPLVVSDESVEIGPEDLSGENVLVASQSVLGNGVLDGIQDIVYVRPQTFDTGLTRAIATEIEGINRRLVSEQRDYLLIGFGRWGTSDPWLGIPVKWGQIGRAKVIVETYLPGIITDPSQGSHFFHNVTSFRVCYFSVSHDGSRGVDFNWLDRQSALEETDHVRHVRLERPLTVRVDGRVGRGVVLHH